MNITMEKTIKYNPLTCQTCYHFVTSEKHYNSCTDVSMYHITESIISTNFKPAMTYGLGGCTVLLMVFFTKDNTPIKYVLGHHPIKENILTWFQQYYTDEYNIVTIIKTPEEYQKINDKWITKTANEDYWNYHIKKINCHLILEPYSLTTKFNDKTKFNSSLYFIMDKMIPKYNDCYGRLLPIIYN
jgi:hypothetical protein